MNIIGKHGMDPRVEQAKRKRSPIVGKNTKRGQGARRRADVATA
jgi:hypothetical protein